MILCTHLFLVIADCALAGATRTRRIFRYVFFPVPRRFPGPLGVSVIVGLTLGVILVLFLGGLPLGLSEILGRVDWGSRFARHLRRNEDFWREFGQRLNIGDCALMQRLLVLFTLGDSIRQVCLTLQHDFVFGIRFVFEFIARLGVEFGFRFGFGFGFEFAVRFRLRFGFEFVVEFGFEFGSGLGFGFGFRFGFTLEFALGSYFLTCRSCCCCLSCCWSNKSLCMLSCVFWSCNNCCWYS